MATLDISLTDTEFVSEVRNSLAGLDASKIPDDTILQNANKIVVPILNKNSDDLKASEDQDSFDNAAIIFTAELSFDSWLAFTRLRDREVETYIDAQQYKSQLEKKTNLALQPLGMSRPPEIPNKVVTIKHDGVNRKVDMQKIWV